ncbi:MAG: hypothetical protein HC913_02760 [Microscillaceae bacterium]|nr:hypothetical protein [Microscillaceae bacterium]
MRDLSFLYYVISIIGVGLYFMFYYGFTIELLWPNAPVWNAYCFAFVVPLTRIHWILFTQSYLHLAQILPQWHRRLYFLMALYAVPMGLALYNLVSGHDVTVLTVNWIGTMGVIVLTMMLAMGYLAWQKGFAPARYFLTANVFFSLGSILFILQETGLLADTWLTRYAGQVGAVLQVILFSLGLADRLKKTREALAQKELEKEKLARDQEIEKQRLVEAQKVQLEYEVAERTSDLREKTHELEIIVEKLRESENKLKALNELKDRFFSIISHDLRSPIATLNAFLNILIHHADEISGEEFQILATRTQQSVENLSLLLDNLLQWSRAQMSQMQYRPQAFAVKALIEETVAVLLMSAENKQIQISIEGPAGLQAYADRDMVSFVVRNLLNNAIKFTPVGGKIRLSAYPQELRLVVMIEDNGVGMPPETLARFQETYAVFSTQGTSGEKGTGLGLLLAENFGKNGSQLFVASHSGVGTRFWFALPQDQRPA